MRLLNNYALVEIIHQDGGDHHVGGIIGGELVVGFFQVEPLAVDGEYFFQVQFHRIAGAFFYPDWVLEGKFPVHRVRTAVVDEENIRLVVTVGIALAFDFIKNITYKLYITCLEN